MVQARRSPLQLGSGVQPGQLSYAFQARALPPQLWQPGLIIGTHMGYERRSSSWHMGCHGIRALGARHQVPLPRSAALVLPKLALRAAHSA